MMMIHGVFGSQLAHANGLLSSTSRINPLKSSPHNHPLIYYVNILQRIKESRGEGHITQPRCPLMVFELFLVEHVKAKTQLCLNVSMKPNYSCLTKLGAVSGVFLFFFPTKSKPCIAT